ncbi:hypothetical protein Vretimale_19702 [Volvox reticuliferus]|uniref:Histone H4 n=1 Tax=Volvox reticuliferus TaxID=1737510 RepID=A0A8J4BXF8_9CHLO|nr:hypothetical protein Vretifemale_832 [Volvox reticuliferus]GIM17185.1 hypothetical protein Vretimale_19702 [Volvox reticuliferus]
MSGKAPGRGRKGIGKGGAKRHRKILRDAIDGINKGSIRRLARRGGVKRLSGLIYQEVRLVLKSYLQKVIQDAVVYTEFGHRSTVTLKDILHAVRRHGQILYGFGPEI